MLSRWRWFRAVAGHPAKALAIVEELIGANQRGYVSPAHIAFAYAGAGDNAVARMVRARIEERSNAMLFFTLDSLFAWPEDPAYARW